MLCKPTADGNLRFLGFRSSNTKRVLRRLLLPFWFPLTFLVVPPCFNAMKKSPFLKVKNSFSNCTLKMDLIWSGWIWLTRVPFIPIARYLSVATPFIRTLQLSTTSIASFVCSWTLRVPLMVPSGKICRNIMARTDHKERGRAQPGGRIGKIGCLHSAWSTWGVFGMDFFGWDLVVVTSLTFFLAMCWFADCSEAFDRIKMTRMTARRTTFDRDMFPERKYCWSKQSETSKA